MKWKYKIDILQSLKENGYPRKRLRDEKIIGEATLQRLKHQQSVSFDVLTKICVLLNCDIGDLLTVDSDSSGTDSTSLDNDE